MIDAWKKEARKVIKLRYPTANEETVETYLNKTLKQLKNRKGMIDNNYNKTKYPVDVLTLYKFIKENKILTAGNGVLFDRDAYNPSIAMLDEIGANRKALKKYRDAQDPNSFEYFMGDLKQNTEKVKMNTWYGISGAIAALFFNVYCATGITFKGRQLISTATLAFEAFLANNIKFINMDDCILFIKNIIMEEDEWALNDSEILDNNISVMQVLQRLKDNMLIAEDFDVKMVYRMLMSCNQRLLNRIYYKNNLIPFCRNSIVKNKIKQAVYSTDSFNNPNITSESQRVYLDSFWNLLEEYVFYNHDYIEKFYRVNVHDRERVVVIDTDSNMLYLYPWFKFVIDEILTKEEIDERVLNTDDFENIIVHTICYELSNMMRATLERYLKKCNVKKEMRKRLDMKNEFYYTRMLIAEVKKSYAAVTKYKEGKPMFGKPDIKGLAIKKSSTNRNASKIFTDILLDDILRSEDINVIKIMRKIKAFESTIRESLASLSKEYLKPADVKDLDAYDDPLKESPVRAGLMWNLIYPDNQIQFPDNFSLLNLKLNKERDLENVKDEKIRERIREQIFNNSNNRIASKGLYILAIPSEEPIPEWTVDVIDYEKITSDLISAFLPVTNTLGVKEITNGDRVMGSTFIAM